MKKFIPIACFLLAITTIPAYAQKYKSTDDTLKLNKEYVKVNNDLADLNAKLTIAKNNLPGYQAKANNAASDAQNAADKSSKDQHLT